MSHPIRFCFALHNHQPEGNFDHVFEQAYQDSYLPFLDVFESCPDLRISLHTSGPLAEWLDAHHGDYLDRLARLVAEGRIEVLGGAFYEAILSMIPARDRVGQITRYTQWLEERLGANVRGMWMPERVWEQALTQDIVAAGIEYTVLDDFHFRNAGLPEEVLDGYYLTEDEGSLLRIFPGSELLRYFIPFRDPHETIDYLRHVAEQHPGAVMVFADDGEKFGTWPETKRHVYENGWLREFFTQLVANQSWLTTTTLADAVSSTPALGKIYLPEGSYREMTEWSLPTPQQLLYDNLHHEMENDPRWSTIRQFVRGGYWRNYKVKYPETDEMYTRMLMISRRLQALQEEGYSGELIAWAQRELYRGQCNCAYWHGAFGGVYLPHLRNAVYNHLIAADNLMNRATGKTAPWVEGVAADYNLDGRPEVMLANDKLVCLVTPAAGGHVYELDVRSICHNLQATLTRREETYHHKIRRPVQTEGQPVASIHQRVVCKQDRLDERLQYDAFPRKTLVDHFYDQDVRLDDVAQGLAAERGDFAKGTYEARLRRNPDRMQVQLSRRGWVGEHNVSLTKGITLDAGSATLEIAYLLEGLPARKPLHFAVEMNFAGMPAGADDRYFYQGQNERLGELGASLDLYNTHDLALVDEWLGLDVRVQAGRPTNFWTFPVASVSQSEGGFELVHQSVVVQPHWFVSGDEQGRWSVTLRIAIDTTLAEGRMGNVEEAAVASSG